MGPNTWDDQLNLTFNSAAIDTSSLGGGTPLQMPTLPPFPKYTPPTGASPTNNLGSKLGFNTGTLSAVGNVLGGIGGLAQAWAALKQIGIAEENLEFQKGAFEKNYNANKTTVNNRIADQNSWKKAQGRTDLAKLVV